MSTSKSLIPVERIEHRILLIRNQKVIIDADLAELYGVQTKALNQAVRRNKKRFPEDFLFQLTKDEKTAGYLQKRTATRKQKIVKSNKNKDGA